MSLFEFVTVFVSIILALALARNLDALGSALDLERRYWVHATWVVVKLMTPYGFWTLIWPLRGAEMWSGPMILLLSGVAVLYYLQVIALVTQDARQVTDWRSHYYSYRIRFFGLNATILVLFAVFAAMGDPAAVRAGWEYAGPSMAGVILLFSIVGMVTANPRVHAGIAVIAALNQALGILHDVVYGAGLVQG